MEIKKMLIYLSNPTKIFFIIIQFFLFLLLGIASFGQTTYYSRISGNWSTPSTWSTSSCGGLASTSYPQNPLDIIVICNQVMIDVNVEIKDVAIQSGGVLTWSITGNFTLTVGGNLNVLLGGKLQNNGTGATIHRLNLKGDFSNLGDVNLYKATDNFVNVSFEGSTDNLITGNGSWSFYGININKTIKTSIVEIQSTQFYTTLNGGIWNYIMGTYYHNNSSTFNLGIPGNFILNANSAIKLSTGTLNFANTSGYLSLRGRLEILSGTINIGKSDGLTPHGILYNSEITGIVPELIVTGGTLNVFQGISYENSTADPFSFTMSNGIINLNIGTNESGTELLRVNDVTGSSFSMSGGTIVMQEKNTAGLADLSVCGTNGTVSSTGGTIQFGDPTSNTNVFSFTPFPNVELPNIKVTGAITKNIILKPFGIGNFKFLSLYIDEGKFFDMSHDGTATDNRSMTITSTYDGSNAFYDNNNGVPNNFICRNSSVIFSGSTDQTIKRLGNPEIFYGLHISKSSGNLRLHCPVNIINNVKFVNGNIISTPSTKITFNAGATATGASNASYVSGPVQRYGVGTFDFPVGKGSIYRSIGISPAGVATDAFTAEYFNIDPDPLYSTSSKGSGIDMLSRCEYWNLTLDAGTTNTRVKLSYGTGSCDLPEYNSFKVGSWNGTQWNDLGRSGATGNNSAGAFQTTGLCTNYGPFTIIACKTPVITLSGSSSFCSGNSLTLTSRVATSYSWSNGETTQSIVVSNSGLYSVTTNIGGCSRSSSSQIVSVHPLPASPNAIHAKNCGSGNLKLGVTGSTGTYYWYLQSTGGTLQISSATYSTPNLTSTTAYYVSAVSGNGCESIRTTVIATINEFPATPVAIDTFRCGPGPIIVKAGSSSNNYKWYEANTGGTAVDSGSTFNISNLNATKDYFISSISPENCESLTRDKLTVSIYNIPADPIGKDSSRCGAGIVNLSASGSLFGYKWYNNSAGGSSLNDSANFAATVTSSSIFYVVSVSDLGCQSTRVPVNATVYELPLNPIGKDSSRCGPGKVYLSATGSTSYNWYNALSGGTSLETNFSIITDSISTSYIYYVSAVSIEGCESPRISVKASILDKPIAPNAGDSTRCGLGRVQLVASGAAANYIWYDSKTKSNVLHNTANYLTEIINSSTFFYVSALSGPNCESDLTTVKATIYSLPENPTGYDTTRCGPGVVHIKASGSNFGYKWYNAISGGNLLHNQFNYTTAITTSANFYVTSVSAEGCESDRMRVTANIITLPLSPSGKDSSHCGPGKVYLSASGSLSSYKWYSENKDEILSEKNSYYTTIDLITTTSFYVSAVSNEGCESGMIPVKASILDVPDSPMVKDSGRCGAGNVDLFVSGSTTNYNWYNFTGATNVLSRTNKLSTGFISNTTKYYVASTNSFGCESEKKIATAFVNSLPITPIGQDTSRCGPGYIHISANGSPFNYKWFDDSTAGNLLNDKYDFSTTIATSTKFYVVSVSKEGCESRRVGVSGFINTIPTKPLGKDSSRCGPGIVILRVSTSTPFTYKWYSNDIDKTSLINNATYTTDNLNVTKTFFVSTLSNEGCESARTPVTATILGIPDAPTIKDSGRCGAGRVDLRASGSPLKYQWYEFSNPSKILSSEDIYTTEYLNLTTKYDVASIDSFGCKSKNTTATAIIYSLPEVPSSHDTARCGPGVVYFAASGSAFGYKWFDSFTGGNSLTDKFEYSTTLTNTTIFFVASVSAEGCESKRREVKGTINPKPTSPSGKDSSRCGPGSVHLSASKSLFSYYWYSNNSDTNFIKKGNEFNTPAIENSTSFYVTSVSDKGCESEIKTEVRAKINPIPAKAIAIDSARCGPGRVIIGARGSTGAFNWYTDNSSVVPAGITPFYTTNKILNNTEFFVSATTPEGCESFPRTSVNALIKKVPEAPIGNDTLSCEKGFFRLSAVNNTGKYAWYTDSSSTKILDSDSIYNTTYLETTTSYFVTTIDNNGCESIRTEVTIIIDQKSAGGSLGKDTIVCSGNNVGSIKLKNYIGTDLKWESSLNNFQTPGNTISNNKDVYEFNNLDANTTYRVIVRNNGCQATSSSSMTVKVKPSPKPGILKENDFVIKENNSGTVTLANYIGDITHWEISTDNFISSQIVNNLTSTISYNNVALNTYYRVLIGANNCPTIHTNSVKISVKKKPISNLDSLYGEMDVPFNSLQSVLLNDQGQDGDSLISLPVSNGETFHGGKITIDQKGFLLYNPKSGFVGIDSVQYLSCIANIPKQICTTTKLYFIIRDDAVRIFPSLSPNNDNINDDWIINNISLFPYNHISIFDRWGNLVYEEKGYNNENKVFKGVANKGVQLGSKELMDGTYFYTLHLGENTNTKSGFLVIKR